MSSYESLTIGEVVVIRRKRARMYAYQLEEASGVYQTVLTKIENNATDFNFLHIIKVLTTLGMRMAVRDKDLKQTYHQGLNIGEVVFLKRRRMKLTTDDVCKKGVNKSSLKRLEGDVYLIPYRDFLKILDILGLFSYAEDIPEEE